MMLLFTSIKQFLVVFGHHNITKATRIVSKKSLSTTTATTTTIKSLKKTSMSPSAVAEITHIQFDFDGTLVNTIDELIEMFAESARLHGKELTPAIIDAIPNISRFNNPLALFERDLGIQVEKMDIAQRYRQFANSRQFKLLPGVERLVRHLHRHQVPMAVATGNYGHVYQTISNQFGDFFPAHFSHAVCGYDDPDVAESKPSPDVYHICAKRFTNPPCTDMSRVLIFEDSITGLTGAVASGAKTVMIANQKNRQSTKPKDQPILDQATVIIDSLEHFKPEMFGLPPFTD